MSGPATRPQEKPHTEDLKAGTTADDPKKIVNDIYPGFAPVVLPQYEARFSVERDTGESVVNVTIVGSPRVVDLIMHAATDAFREEVEG